MTPVTYHPWVHRFSLATATVALLPIGIGALVTTMNWGMAFPDWPTSDGQNMLLYPWLTTLHGAMDKFTEHGHRLAGMLIGIFSIGLCGLLWWKEPRRSVCLMGTAVLLCVIAQGLLGGLRVIADEQQAALVHGAFAACVFTLMCAVAQVTSRTWCEGRFGRSETRIHSLRPLSLILPVLIFGQFLLGGQLRHLGRGLHEHLGFAAIVVVTTIAAFVLAWRSKSHWLKSAATMLVVFLLVQVLLGVASWVTKFGWPQAGYVAVQHSPLQVTVRSSHTVMGMLLFMTSIILAMRTTRLAREISAIRPVSTASTVLDNTPAKMSGGVA